jgi:ribosomal protein S18 acetylase RimI-like enzyme
MFFTRSKNNQLARGATVFHQNVMELKTTMSNTFDIKNCSFADLDAVMSLYDSAVRLQTEKKMVVWPRFERSFVEKEIQEQRQWKLLIDDQIACNWAVAFEDKEIWGARDNNNAIYIHRIATNPAFRGNRFVDVIVKWAKSYARSKGKKYVRLDTLGNNTRLIEHYTSAGFKFLGIFKLTDTRTLPEHYQREPNCCLFEIEVNN